MRGAYDKPVHFSDRVDGPPGPPTVWESGNHGDLVEAKCGKFPYRWDATNVATEVTCTQCVALIVGEVEDSLLRGEW